MGGFDGNKNFILNCSDWKKIPDGDFSDNSSFLRLAPMTGAVENTGYDEEKKFYFDMVNKCVENGIRLSIGDGCPDEKLLWGIEAVECAGKKAAVFIKPYENKKILERMEWAEKIMEYCGIDIDAYNIITMRNKVKLEKKTCENLMEIKNYLGKKNIPFIVKGIFTEEDVSLVRELKPDVAFISNHGGRVPQREGSTAQFLAERGLELKKYCGQLWIDGGIRSMEDFNKAQSYGVSEILVGRPFVTALCYGLPFSRIL